MKRNILILVCIAFMFSAVYLALRYYTKLAKAEKDILANKETIEEQKNLIEQQNKALLERNNKLEVTTLEEKIKNTAGADSAEIRKYKTDAINFIEKNNNSAYQTALKLEQEGFNAISDDKFDVALEKFKQIVAIAPSFHSAYEIYNVLNKNKSKFNDPEIKTSIKKDVVTKYKWKAPETQIKRIEKQLSQKATVSSQTVTEVKTAVAQPVKPGNKVNSINNYKNLNKQ